MQNYAGAELTEPPTPANEIKTQPTSETLQALQQLVKNSRWMTVLTPQLTATLPVGMQPAELPGAPVVSQDCSDC